MFGGNRVVCVTFSLALKLGMCKHYFHLMTLHCSCVWSNQMYRNTQDFRFRLLIIVTARDHNIERRSGV